MTVMLVMLIAAFPVLVSETVWVALGVKYTTLPKAKDFGETVGMGDALPVPDRATVCGLVGSESMMFKVPVRAPVACGVIVRLIVHEPRLASVVPHVVV